MANESWLSSMTAVAVFSSSFVITTSITCAGVNACAIKVLGLADH